MGVREAKQINGETPSGELPFAAMLDAFNAFDLGRKGVQSSRESPPKSKDD